MSREVPDTLDRVEEGRAEVRVDEVPEGRLILRGVPSHFGQQHEQAEPEGYSMIAEAFWPSL